MGNEEASAEGTWTEQLRDGTPVLIRPIRVDDIEMERLFIEAMSPASRRFRFLSSMCSPGAALLKQMTDIDHATDAAYVAVRVGREAEQEIGVARFSAAVDAKDGEFAVAVADDWQRKGLGTVLMRRLVKTALLRGLDRLHSGGAADNEPMRRLAERAGLRHERDSEDATQIRYSMDLRPSKPGPRPGPDPHRP